MAGQHVALLGGRGFLGSATQKELRRREVPFWTVSRSPGPAEAHRRGDIEDPLSLRRALSGADIIVNFVASSPLLPPGAHGRYYRQHLRGVRNLLNVCRELGVSRLVHIGALGVRTTSNAPYAWTKAIAEAEVDDSAVPSTVYSPSILFGKDSELIRTLHRASILPVVPVPRVATLFQPIFVGDLGSLIADTVSPNRRSPGTSPDTLAPAGGSVHYEVAGPDTYSGTQFADLYLRTRGCVRVYVPQSAVEYGIRAAAGLHIPGFPVQLPEMLSMENVLTGAFPGIRTVRSYADWLQRLSGSPGAR